MSRMRSRQVFFVAGLLTLFVSASLSRAEESKIMGAPLKGMQYPTPRYPRYLVKPNMNELMRAARYAVRQPVGRSPLGIVTSGQSVYVLVEFGQDPQVWEAIRKAWEEKGVTAHAIGAWDLMGISKAEYDRRMQGNVVHGNEAWKEAGIFRVDYKPFFSEEIQKQFGDPITDEYLRDTFLTGYLDKHPEIKYLYAGVGNAGAWKTAIGKKHADKMLGNWIYFRPIDLLSKAAEFPTDVWNLVEEKILRPRPFLSEVSFQDPEGTNLHWTLTQEQAQDFARSFNSEGGASNHISIYPNPLRSALQDGGVIVAHANHVGIYPSMRVTLDAHGGVKSIQGGGRVAEMFRTLLNHPKFKNLQFPHAPGPGYWFLMQDGFATNPKVVRSMPALIEGDPWLPNGSERNRAGVQHLAFTYSSNDPEDLAYAKQKGVPLGGGQHNFHMHNYFPTVKWRLRDTGEWITIAEKGYVEAYDDPEVRALASRYGDPDTIFRYEWIPSIPGVNVLGDYKKDFAGDPWGYLMAEWKKVQEGTYQYFLENAK